MGIQFWATTDVGRVRKHNEDNFLVDKRLRLFVVCDGMGGHAAGEVASAMSVQVVRDVVLAARPLIDRVKSHDQDLTARNKLLELLVQAIQTASAKVFETAKEDDSKRGMGTTCSLLLLTDSRAFIAHVGDSRVYVLRQGNLRQVTEDHSLYNEMLRLGKIKPGEYEKLPNRNAVTRAVGIHDTVEVDVHELAVKAGDRFLLCSDGLSGYFKDEAHARTILLGKNLKAVTKRCIEHALEGGGKDNITAILIDLLVPDTATAPREGQGSQHARQLLARSPFFAHFAPRELEAIVQASSICTLPAQATYLQRPDQVSLLLVLQGTLEAEHEAGVRYKTGEVLGILGFIDGRSEAHGCWRAACEEPAELLEIPRRHLMNLMKQDAKLAMKWMWNFLQHFSHHLHHIPDLHDRTLNQPVRKAPPRLPKPSEGRGAALAPASSLPTRGRPPVLPSMLEDSDPNLAAASPQLPRSSPPGASPLTEDLRRTMEFSRHLEDLEPEDRPEVLFAPGSVFAQPPAPPSPSKIKGVPPATPRQVAEDMNSTVRLDPSELGLKPSYKKPNPPQD